MAEPITGAPPSTGWRRVATNVSLAALRASLKVSPRPTAWVIRRVFAKNGAQVAAKLQTRVPAGVTVVIDERYDEDRDARFDVYTPDPVVQAGRRAPTVVWTHGGGFVGGSKDELGGYLTRIAAAGFTVVGVNYSRAPEAKYPTPVRQVMTAVRHLQVNADRLHVDPARLVLAGDSAGAQITAQVAAIVTNPSYREHVGVEPTLTPDQLRAVVLCCGLYDWTLIDPDSPFRDFVHAVAWSYSGNRDYLDDDWFMSAMTVAKHVSEAFPPAFITAGHADPLLAHSLALASALESKGVDVDMLLYPEDHQPRLAHEYQFDLDLDDGRLALQRVLAFLQGHTAGNDGDDGAD
jgi:acetyl esterase/lipase